jgi:hypothetical protein
VSPEAVVNLSFLAAPKSEYPDANVSRIRNPVSDSISPVSRNLQMKNELKDMDLALVAAGASKFGQQSSGNSSTTTNTKKGNKG